MTNNNSTIYFYQIDIDTFKAVCNGDLVATIKHLDGPDFGKATYRIVYYRPPSARKSLPAKTTRTVNATYDTIQKRILNMGWL